MKMYYYKSCLFIYIFKGIHNYYYYKPYHYFRIYIDYLYYYKYIYLIYVCPVCRTARPDRTAVVRSLESWDRAGP